MNHRNGDFPSTDFINKFHSYQECFMLQPFSFHPANGEQLENDCDYNLIFTLYHRVDAAAWPLTAHNCRFHSVHRFLNLKFCY